MRTKITETYYIELHSLHISVCSRIPHRFAGRLRDRGGTTSLKLMNEVTKLRNAIRLPFPDLCIAISRLLGSPSTHTVRGCLGVFGCLGVLNHSQYFWETKTFSGKLNHANNLKEITLIGSTWEGTGYVCGI